MKRFRQDVLYPLLAAAFLISVSYFALDLKAETQIKETQIKFNNPTSLGSGNLLINSILYNAATTSTNPLWIPTKDYVDAVSSGGSMDVSLQRTTAKVAADTDIVLSGTQTIDDVSVATGDIVLASNQIDQSENGLYVVGGGAWPRATDFNTAAEILKGTWMLVSQGTVYTNTGWYVKESITTLDSDPIFIERFSGAGASSPPVSGSYLQLDALNGPLTGDTGITKIAPSFSLVDSVRSSSLTISKIDTNLEGKITNTTIQDGSILPYAMSFNTLNSQYLTCGDTNELDGTSSMTVAFWFKSNAPHTREYTVVQKGSAASNMVFGAAIGQGTGFDVLYYDLIFRYKGGALPGTVYVVAQNVYSVTDWNYVVWIYNGSLTGNANRLKLYVNGIQRTILFDPPYPVPATLASSAAPVVIGNSGAHNTPFKGWIDEVQLYNTAWSAGDVASNYLVGGLSVGRYGDIADPSLVAGWHFDEGTGATIDNYEGSAGYDCAVSGSVPFVSSTKAISPATTTTAIVDVISSKAPAGGGDGDGLNTVGDPDAATVINGKYISLATGTTATNVTTTGNIEVGGGYAGGSGVTIESDGDMLMTGKFTVDGVVDPTRIILTGDGTASPTVEISTSGAGPDISGTGGTWSISKTGVITGNGSGITGIAATLDSTLENGDTSATHSINLTAGTVTAANFSSVGTSTASRFVSTVPPGIPPFTVDSTTVVPNLNVSQLDGNSEAAFFKLDEDEDVTGVPNFSGGLTGATPPLTVDSTFKVDNLNADLLDGNHSTAFMSAAADNWVNTIGDTMTGPLYMSFNTATASLHIKNNSTGNVALFDATGETGATSSVLLKGDNITFNSAQLRIEGTGNSDGIQIYNQKPGGNTGRGIFAYTNGNAYTVWGYNNGTGTGGVFEQANPAAQNHGMDASCVGRGSAVVAHHENAKTLTQCAGDRNCSALWSYQAGQSGASIYAEISTNGSFLNNFNPSPLIAGIHKGLGDLINLRNSTDTNRFVVDHYGAVTAAAGFSTPDNSTASLFVSTVGIGTAPFTVTSTTLVANLNADYLDGNSEAAFFKLADDEVVAGVPSFNGGLSGATAPFNVDSTFKVDNLNADLLDGSTSADFAGASHNHDVTYLKLDASNDPLTGVLTVNNDITATGTITGAGFTTAGNATAAYFFGDGSNLTNLPAAVASTLTSVLKAGNTATETIALTATGTQNAIEITHGDDSGDGINMTYGGQGNGIDITANDNGQPIALVISDAASLKNVLGIGNAGTNDSIAITNTGTNGSGIRIDSSVDNSAARVIDISQTGDTNTPALYINSASTTRAEPAVTLLIASSAPVATNSVGFQFSTTGSNSDLMRLFSLYDSATAGPDIRIELFRTSHANGDELGKIIFNGFDSGGVAIQEYASIKGLVGTETAGSEGGKLTFNAFVNGTNTTLLEADGSIGSGQVTVSADLVYSGADTGVLYGNAYGVAINWATNSVVQNAWYTITDSDIVEGATNGVLWQNNQELKVSATGTYQVSWSINPSSTVANQHIECGIGVNDSIQASGQNHYDNINANDVMPTSGVAILELNANDRVSLMIRDTDAGTPNLTILEYGIVVSMLGGK